jgi:hypothetical protein
MMLVGTFLSHTTTLERTYGLLDDFIWAEVTKHLGVLNIIKVAAKKAISP